LVEAVGIQRGSGLRASARRIGPGENVAHVLPGDFILVRNRGWMSTCVYAMQRLRFRKRGDRAYAHWSHAALVADLDGRLIEAVPHGVVYSRLDRYREREYHYVRLNTPPRARREAVAFAASCVGQRHWAATGALLALRAITRGRVPLSMSGPQACVSVVAGALSRAGETFERPAVVMLPGDLARHYGVQNRPPREEQGRRTWRRIPFGGRAATIRAPRS
jgi:hypothetical protein